MFPSHPRDAAGYRWMFPSHPRDANGCDSEFFGCDSEFRGCDSENTDVTSENKWGRSAACHRGRDLDTAVGPTRCVREREPAPPPLFFCVWSGFPFVALAVGSTTISDTDCHVCSRRRCGSALEVVADRLGSGPSTGMRWLLRIVLVCCSAMASNDDDELLNMIRRSTSTRRLLPPTSPASWYSPMTLITGMQSKLRQRTIEQHTDELCNDIGSDNDETDGAGAGDEGYGVSGAGDEEEREPGADDEEDNEPPPLMPYSQWPLRDAEEMFDGIVGNARWDENVDGDRTWDDGLYGICDEESGDLVNDMSDDAVSRRDRLLSSHGRVNRSRTHCWSLRDKTNFTEKQETATNEIFYFVLSRKSS